MAMRLHALVALVSLCSSSVQAQTLDQQERCAQQARRSFQEIENQNRIEAKRIGMSRVADDYQSHYNTKLGKCLMFVETTDKLGGTVTTNAYVIDANERRIYATYLWISRDGKKYWEVPPFSCELIPGLRQKTICKSREEFDTFVASYMEE